jgi:proteic killer suppression protein
MSLKDYKRAISTPPLYVLTGDKKGQYAVKVSGNWREFFEFYNGDAYVVDYDDYH